MKYYAVVCMPMLLFFIAGCLISPPPIRLTGEKTAVENQVIGEYREIEPDAWSVSSAKTGVQRQKGSSTAAGDEIIFGALKIRELNENRIRSCKNEGSLGEASTGYIVYRPFEKYEKNEDLKKNLMTLVSEENKARKIIFERSAVLSGREKPSAADLAPLEKSFAAEQKESAKKNDWIQESDGTWIRKK